MARHITSMCSHVSWDGLTVAKPHMQTWCNPLQAHPRSRLLQAMPDGEGPLPRLLAVMESAYLERGCPRTQPISKCVLGCWWHFWNCPATG